MFMCTKSGEEQPLKRSILFEKTSDMSAISTCNSDIDSIKETLQRSLITESAGVNTYYVEINQIWKWTKSIGYNMTKKREECDKDEDDKRKKCFNQNECKMLANTEYELSAEIWTKSYLKSIKSSGLIHSVHTGKHDKFIMCNIRNMNICEELHEDYFNDSTVYINFEEKQFLIRCNRIPCNKKLGMATHDLEHLNFLCPGSLIQRIIVAC